MKYLTRAFKTSEKLLYSMQNIGVYLCRINSSDNILLDKSIQALSGSLCSQTDEIASAFNIAATLIPQYHFLENAVAFESTTSFPQFRSVGEARVRTDVLLCLARELGYLACAAEPGSIYISAISDANRKLKSEIPAKSAV